MATIVDGYLNSLGERLLSITEGCRPDMHEPAEQDIKARIIGDHLDNAFGEHISESVVEIMETHDHQMSVNGYVDTPGGLEHMGDVWSLLDRWRDRIVVSRC